MKTILKIKNFKSLEDIELELKPKTFLLGPNGSGKSTLLKLLLFIKENIFSQKSNFGTKIKYKLSNQVDLGSFSEMVTNNDLTREIKLLFESKFDLKYFNKIKEKGSTLDYIKSKFIDGSFDENIEYVINLFGQKKYSGVADFLFENKHLIKYLLPSLIDSYNFSFKFAIKKSNDSEDYYLEYQIIDLDTDSSISHIIDPNGDHDSIISDKDEHHITAYINPRINIFKNLKGLVKIENFKFVNRESFLIDFSEHFGSKFDKYVEYYYQALEEGTIGEAAFDNSIYKDEDSIAYDDPDPGNDFDEAAFDDSRSNEMDANERAHLTVLGIIQLYKFIYVYPSVLKSHLDIVHLSAIREIPKHHYFLSNGQFSDDEYYGLLNSFKDKYFMSLFSEVVQNDKGNYLSSLDNMDSLYTKFIEIAEINSLTQDKQQKEFSGIWLKILDIDEERLGLRWYPCLTQLQKLHLCKSIYFIKDLNNVYGSVVIEAMNGSEVNLAESSSGLLQILPIILELYSYHNPHFDSCIFIEQPELHLHPKLQASLSAVFLDAAKPIIVETHSEHIVRKIQVLIAKGEIEKDRVAVYYFDKDEKTGTTSIKEMKMEDNGFFKDTWPNGFFDEASDLAYALLEAQINRKN